MSCEPLLTVFSPSSRVWLSGSLICAVWGAVGDESAFRLLNLFHANKQQSAQWMLTPAFPNAARQKLFCLWQDFPFLPKIVEKQHSSFQPRCFYSTVPDHPLTCTEPGKPQTSITQRRKPFKDISNLKLFVILSLWGLSSSTCYLVEFFCSGFSPTPTYDAHRSWKVKFPNCVGAVSWPTISQVIKKGDGEKRAACWLDQSSTTDPTYFIQKNLKS